MKKAEFIIKMAQANPDYLNDLMGWAGYINRGNEIKAVDLLRLDCTTLRTIATAEFEVAIENDFSSSFGGKYLFHKVVIMLHENEKMGLHFEKLCCGCLDNIPENYVQ